MAKIHKVVDIHAPVEKVFNFMIHPENLPEIWPSMVEVSHVQSQPDGRHSFDWVYKMAGIKFTGHGESNDLKTNQHVTTVNQSGIPSRFEWEYKKANGGTELVLDVEYTVPLPVVNKLAETIVVKLNEHEAEVMLANLKSRMEE